MPNDVKAIVSALSLIVAAVLALLELIAGSTGILHVHHGDCCIHGARNVDFPRGWRKGARCAAVIKIDSG